MAEQKSFFYNLVYRWQRIDKNHIKDLLILLVKTTNKKLFCGPVVGLSIHLVVTVGRLHPSTALSDFAAPIKNH